jgi:hypothetical protein
MDRSAEWMKLPVVQIPDVAACRDRFMRWHLDASEYLFLAKISFYLI